jgi:predicted amidohydrolase YtcJ
MKIPLLKDNHNHLFAYASIKNAFDISDVKTKTEAFKIFENLKKNDINLVCRWFDNIFSFNKNEIEDLPPLIICNNSLHKYVFNSAAASYISIKFPEWAENNHNQEWVEKNIMHIFAFIAGIQSFDENSVKDFIKTNLNKGLAFASDMYVTDKIIIDSIGNSEISKFTEIYTDTAIFQELNNVQRTNCKGIKSFLDGALGACSAAISEEYKKGDKGFLSYSDKEIESKLEKDFSLQTSLAIHCIGDRAIEQALKTISIFRNKYPNTEIRLEHAQFITPKQARMAKNMGIILSMQPNFNADSIIYSDRLPERLCKTNNPFRMLIDDYGFEPGKDLIFGSDGMPTGVVDAINQSLFPAVQGQEVAPEEFIKAYCVNDYENGYIQIDIDKKNRFVDTNVIINNPL